MVQKEYREDRIVMDKLPPEPMALFAAWYAAASATEPWRGSPMVLATGAAGSALSARVVLMRGHDTDGLRFYTNYDSRKGRSLQSNPQAAAVFWWPTQVQQVRFEGTVVPVPTSESDTYFAQRPRGSQIGAWVSRQSARIESIAALEANYARQASAFAEQETIPRPPNWGGYLLQPTRVEFWQGGEHRLHDRIVFTREQDGSWCKGRLSP